MPLYSHTYISIIPKCNTCKLAKEPFILNNITTKENLKLSSLTIIRAYEDLIIRYSCCDTQNKVGKIMKNDIPDLFSILHGLISCKNLSCENSLIFQQYSIEMCQEAFDLNRVNKEYFFKKIRTSEPVAYQMQASTSSLPPENAQRRLAQRRLAQRRLIHTSDISSLSMPPPPIAKVNRNNIISQGVVSLGVEQQDNQTMSIQHTNNPKEPLHKKICLDSETMEYFNLLPEVTDGTYSILKPLDDGCEQHANPKKSKHIGELVGVVEPPLEVDSSGELMQVTSINWQPTLVKLNSDKQKENIPRNNTQ